MRILLILFALTTLALILADTGFATQSLTGTVRTGGSKGNEAVMIEQKILSSSHQKNPVVTHLCKDNLWDRIKKLNGLKIHLLGSYRMTENKSSRCFSGQEFTVLQMSSGRPPLIGTLSQKDGYYHLTTENGKLIKLNEKNGMKELLDKKVILDVKPPPPLKEGVNPGVASFMAYP